MNRRKVLRSFDEILEPLGYKREMDTWLKHRDIVSIAINLQKSQWSDKYYINYGYIINDLPLYRSRMHIQNQVTQQEMEAGKTIPDLLDFGNDVDDDSRLDKLQEFLAVQLIPAIEKVKTISDINRLLAKRATLSDIPIIVKNYLGIPVE